VGGQSESAEAYRDFLKAQPSDAHADEAEQRLAELDYQEACRLRTLLAYKRFLQAHPRAPQAPDVKARLETLRFNTTEANPSVEAWRNFLREHPAGAHHVEAEKQLALLERGAAVDAAKQPVLDDDEAFAQAQRKGPLARLAYLRDFPLGAHREEAHVLLFADKVEGLLYSGEVDRARDEVAKSPLGPRLQDFTSRLSAAEQLGRLMASKGAKGVGALLVRPQAELTQSLSAEDPLERWQAEEELSQFVSVDTLEPLFHALRTGRNPRVRLEALESLRTLVRAFPPGVAEYELGTRLHALTPEAGSAEVHFELAVLWDLLGDFEAAKREYRDAFDPENPDPVVLHRFIELREARQEPFSAAVAARQLAVWAEGVATAAAKESVGTASYGTARQLCAAAREAEVALAAITRAEGHPVEFPEDLKSFHALAERAVRTTRAKLTDAELALRTRVPSAAPCADRAVEDRIVAGEAARLQVVRALSREKSRWADQVLSWSATHDPSLSVREAAKGKAAAAAR
jgi:hypothetical protein